MAQTFTLKSHSYDGRYLELRCTQTRDAANNRSHIQWTLSAKGGASSAYTTGPTTVKIGDATVYYKAKTSYSTGEFPAAKGEVNGLLLLGHQDDGTAKVTVSIKTNIYTGTLKTTSATWTLDAIDRYAVLKKAPDFTDEENLTLTYTAPGDLDSLTAVLRLGEQELVRRENTGSFVFTPAERELLRSKTPNASTLALTAALLSVRKGVSYESMLPVTMTVVPAPPIVTVTATDTNEAVAAVTGDASVLVAGVSHAQVSVDARGQKGATIQTVQVTQNDRTLTGSGVLAPVGNGPILVTVTDSRGLRATVQATNPILPYTTPTCRVVQNTPTGEGRLPLTVTGSYYADPIGNTENSLAVYCQYKAVEDTDYGSWQQMRVDASGGDYTAQAELQLPDYRKTYLVRARAVDALTQTLSEPLRFVATPVFDWSGEDFRFHVPVQFQGKSLLDFCYPVDSIYISYSHQDPGVLFGGIWERIENVFLWATSPDGIIGHTDGEAEHKLTVSEIPSHNHGVWSRAVYAGGGNYVAHTNQANGSATYSYVTDKTGGGAAHNNMPPYMNVSVWRRIA